MTINPPPSTDWQERVGADEAERHAAFAEQIVALQTRVNAKHGPGRAFHRKQIAGLRGALRVVADEPELRQGLFAEPATHPVLIRLSNGNVTRQADAIPDVRGFAVSVRGLSGPGALAETTDRQDFLLINRPAFAFPDSREFAALVGASAHGQAALVKHFVATYGPVKGPLELARVTKDMLRPFTGFATATFFSAAPIAYGPYAVQVRLIPVGARFNPLAATDWHSDVADRLRAAPLEFELQVQFFRSEDVTPIENLRNPWPADASPFHPVARITVPVQDLDDADGSALAEQIEADRFDPWSALAAHRPLGEVMRARKVAYFPSVQARRGGAPAG